MAKLQFHPLTPERWGDLEALFGAKGACGGCWCMWWRLSAKEWNAGKGEGNHDAFRRRVENGPAAPGILAYAADDEKTNQPVGWVAVAPRAEYPRMEKSSIVKPIDDQPVWCVSCLYVANGWRKQGLSVNLLKAAVAFAGQHGARIVEGYPFEPKKPTAGAFIWTGTTGAYLRAGFAEAARHNPTRPIMRATPGKRKRAD